MGVWQFVRDNSPLSYWLIAFLLSWFAFAIYNGWFKARKIQPRGFSWKVFRAEVLFALINLAIGATVLGYLTTTLTANGIISFHKESAAWWVIALEYIAYFFLFDTWFYWLHRAMHVDPMYTWVHKLHHRSTAPNLLTTLSVNPLESLINGGFVPLFTAVLTVHQETMLFITPTSIIMGLYVHSGYEFLPRWWNKTWATKWFITTTFHDQHHKFFRWNFGGYTTIWDYLCGTVRNTYEKDFDQAKARLEKVEATPVTAQSAASKG